MSLRWSYVAFVLIIGACGGGAAPTSKNEPTTAKEKQLRDAKAEGEVDDTKTKWGKWRYTGDRNDCFFVVGKKCFKTEKAACSSLRCKGKCEASGGGPAIVACEKS